MLDIRQCKMCYEIKSVKEFERVKTGEEFVASMDENGLAWQLKTFEDLLCKDCISRILLNGE